MFFSKKAKQEVELPEASSEVVELVAKCLRLPAAEVKDSIVFLGEIKSYRFSAKMGSLIIGPDSSLLFAPANVPINEHIAAYKEGRRTESSMFNNR